MQFLVGGWALYCTCASYDSDSDSNGDDSFACGYEWLVQGKARTGSKSEPYILYQIFFLRCPRRGLLGLLII